MAQHHASIMFQNPAHTLIIYGSLAPGEKNHHIVAHIKGQWLNAKVFGSLENMGWGANYGYLGFRKASQTTPQEIPVHILISEELPQNWEYLDDFEGDGYQRVLCEYELNNGETSQGYIYAVSE